MDNAVRFAINMQEQAGIDILSDGEWRRESYVDVVAEIMHGFRWVAREVFAYHQVVTRKLTPRRPGVVAEEARFLRQNREREGAKRCLFRGGFSTMVQPAASAGPALRVIIASGKFQGVMQATTPIGSFVTMRRLSG